ncbi:hypothetical protein ACWV27_23985 [Massilia varians]
MMLHDKNHRPIACDTCNPEDPTMLTAWASDWLLENEGYDSIDEMEDEDINRLKIVCPQDCAVEGYCHPCNGPDDGDDGNQDD